MINSSSATQPSESAVHPTDLERRIYHWVKFEGNSQSSAAREFDVSQPTVSRIIQRYERYRAHAAPRHDGELDHAERLKAQRWLTYERNELILANCLRIASEMEGFVDTSKSTISRPAQNPSGEKTIRTVHETIDRSGIAARYLRLAFRINMEQLKLAQQEEPPTPSPLTAEDQSPLAASSHINDADGATPTPPQAPAVNNLNNLNSPLPAEFASTDSQPCTCAESSSLQKNISIHSPAVSLPGSCPSCFPAAFHPITLSAGSSLLRVELPS